VKFLPDLIHGRSNCLQAGRKKLPKGGGPFTRYGYTGIRDKVLDSAEKYMKYKDFTKRATRKV
jgi:hypothetical protein